VAACYSTIAACVPYLTLKALWLAGDPVGAADAAGAAQLVDTRHVVGDAVTAGMELVAVVLVVALTHRWGRRLPAWLVLAPIWVGTGLLAPIAVGVPLGLLAQAFAGGSPAPLGNGSQGWLYVVADGGFIVQAVGLSICFLGYVHDRWPRLSSMRITHLPAAGRRERRVAAGAAVVAAGFAATTVGWAVTDGPGWGGPAGFETVTQRAFLLVNGVLVLGAAIGVPALLGRRGTGRLVAPLAVVWVGTSVTVLSGPTHVAVSHQGQPGPVLVAAASLATASGLILTALAARCVRASRSQAPPNDDVDRGPVIHRLRSQQRTEQGDQA